MVKLVSSYINYTIAQYITEPINKLKDWLKPYESSIPISNIYFYEYYYKKTNSTEHLKNLPILSKLIEMYNKILIPDYKDKVYSPYVKSHYKKINIENMDNFLNIFNYVKDNTFLKKYIKNNISKSPLLSITQNTIDLLSSNDNIKVLKFLEKHPYLINWEILMKNPHPYAYKMFYPRCIIKDNFRNLLHNTNEKVGEIIKLCKISNNVSYKIFENSSLWAYEIISKTLAPNLSILEYDCLCDNPSEWAIKILTENQSKINWRLLSRNYMAKDLITNNLDKISWRVFCWSVGKYEKQWMIDILYKYPKNIDWITLNLFDKKFIIDLMEKYKKYINFDTITIRSSFFEKDISSNKYYKLFDKLLHKTMI